MTHDHLTSILIVDDDARARYATSELLRPLGCDVVEAPSGEAALQLAEHTTFAVVLLDVRMPGRDGFDTAVELRRTEVNASTPLIFVSAHHDEAYASRAYSTGASDYLAKPFDALALRAKVSVFVELHRRNEDVKRQIRALRDAELAAARVEDELRVSEERQRLRDVFIGILGHDLRNPLGAVAMGAQLLLLEELSPKARNVVAKILSGTEKMSHLIRDVLDFARGQLGGGIPIFPTETNMAHACESVVEEHRLRSPSRQIDLDVRDDLRGRWDRERVEQALSNLVSNALQHGDGKVEVRACVADGAVVVEVHNSGTPIPAELLPGIFEPFRKGDASAAGLGLGLYVVREVARAHGAVAEVESSRDHGTTFRISWPRVATQAPAARDA
jgi:signal transduction histidine kinase